MVAITGTSGSGKSTLLNILSCLDAPTSGSYYFKDTCINELSSEALGSFRTLHFSHIFQSYWLIPHLSIMDNIVLPQYYQGRSLIKSEEDAHSIAKQLDISQHLDKKPKQLSGGQQQRACIARALMSQTPVIFADEPTGALDQENSHAIMNIFKQLNQQQGKTIVIVTHDHEMANYCRLIHPVTSLFEPEAQND